MRSPFLFSLLLLGLAAVQPSHAQSPLNPLNWFGGTEEDAAQELRVAGPEEEAAARELLASGKSKMEAGNLGGAKRNFKKVAKSYPTAKAAGEARYLQGRIFMARERWVKAFETLQEVVTYHPNFDRFDRVISAQFECATALMEGARVKMFGVIPTFKQYGEAVRQFEQIVRNAPYGDYAPLSLMNLALVAEKRGDSEEAIDALDRLINFYPQSMLAPDAYYNLAEVYSGLVQGPEYDQGSTRQAISYYEDFLILFPKSNYLGEVEANLEQMENLLASSRLNLGDFYYFYRSNNTAALVFYNETITIAPDSEAAEEARARIEDIEAGVRPTTGAGIVRRLLFLD
ncbi:MAG: outer membrane protein assembly factor BamD [Verrucomicrobiota bacterium]